MTRFLILVLAGIATGSAVVCDSAAQDGRGPVPSPAAAERDAPSGDNPDTPTSVADRAAFYAHVATADRATVEALARTAAARPTDSEQRFVLDAALRRYLEIDPGRALDFARELNGATREFDFLGPLYENWARIDRDAALAAVGRAADPRESRAAAMAVLRAFGDEQGAIERVATMVRGVDPNRFRVDAIGLRAASYPLTALREALAFTDPATRKSAAESALAFSARSAPREAMAVIDGIADPDLKSALQTTALRNWDASDPEGMLAYLPRLDAATQREILRSAPAQIARANPERAIDLVEQMPLGQERQQMLTSVAREYARTDPEKAVAWATRLDPPQPEVVGMVFEQLALIDPLRAFDLALNVATPAARMSALRSAVQKTGPNASYAPALAEKVLALEDGEAKDELFETVLHSWSVDNVKAAAEWLVAHGDRVSLQVLLTMGDRFAQRDPEAIAPYLDRVPSAARGAWISAIAQSYGRSNPQQALAFLAQFRGDPGYQAGTAVVARELAPYDPPAAAAMLGNLDTAYPTPGPGARSTPQQADIQSAALRTAQQWARSDPRAAAAWALGQRNEWARMSLVFVVSMGWTRADARGARDWILSLPTGADRDTALRGLVGGTSDVATLDAALMNAWSSPEMRQRILSAFAGPLARNDAQAARRLLDQYVTDPTMRAAAERQIEFAANRPWPPGLMPADPTLPRPTGARPDGLAPNPN